jgi:hypothetical protein
MKSLPEIKFWLNVKAKLQRYSEEPDDNWDLIAAKIPSRQIGGWMDYTGHFFSALALVSLMLLIQPGHSLHRTLASNIAGNNPNQGTSGSSASVVEPHAELRSAISGSDDGIRQVGKGDSIAADKQPILLSAEPNVASHIATPDRKAISAMKVQVYMEINNEQHHSSISSNMPTKASPEKNATGFEAMQANENSSSGNHAESLPSHADKTIEDSSHMKNGVEGDSVQMEVPMVAKVDTLRIMTKRKDEKKKESWFNPIMYTIVSPSLSYYKITPDRSDDLLVTRIHKDGLVSQNRLGIQLEAGIHHQLSNSFEAFAGFSYFTQHQSVSYDYLTTQVEKIESTGQLKYTISPTTATRNFNFTMRNAGLNAGVLYLLKDSRLSHRIGAGIQYQKGFISYKSEGSVEKSQTDFLSFMLMYRLQINLSEKMDGYIQPGFSQSILTQKIAGEPFEIKPYRVGVGVGFLYRF